MAVKIPVDQLAKQVSAEVLGDATRIIEGAETLENAQSGDLSFVIDSTHLHSLKTTQATAVLISRNLVDSLREKETASTLLIVEDARRSFIQVLEQWYPAQTYGNVGISRDAFVHPSAQIGEETNIHPGARIGENAVIGEHCNLHSGVCVGPGSRIGNHTTLHPNVVLYPTVQIGERVTIHAGAVIGADGFSYHLAGDHHEKIPHFGTVHIEDDVEIGANATIDRSFVGVTLIGRGTKIDNLVQVAHNCEVGPHNLLAAQVGLAGSVSTGKYVMLGGQAGVTPHVHLGDKTMLSAQAGVTKSVEGGMAYYGTPAQPHRTEHKQIMAVRKLPQMREKLRELTAQIQAMEAQLQTHAELLNPK